MRSGVDRRFVLLGLTALAACEPGLARNQYRFRMTDAAREPFLAATRAFAADEGLRVTEESFLVGQNRVQVFALDGWRTQILMQSYYDGDHTISNQFYASVLSTHQPMPWALSDEGLEAFATRFEGALASVPGVEVERVSIPEEYL